MDGWWNREYEVANSKNKYILKDTYAETMAMNFYYWLRRRSDGTLKTGDISPCRSKFKEEKSAIFNELNDEEKEFFIQQVIALCVLFHFFLSTSFSIYSCSFLFVLYRSKIYTKSSVFMQAIGMPMHGIYPDKMLERRNYFVTKSSKKISELLQKKRKDQLLNKQKLILREPNGRIVYILQL